MKLLPIKNATLVLSKYFRLLVGLSDAKTESEREDLLVEIENLKSQSIVVSICSAFIDIHVRHPVVLPLLLVTLSLKIAFY